MEKFEEIAKKLVKCHKNRNFIRKSSFDKMYKEYGIVYGVIMIEQRLNELKVCMKSEDILSSSIEKSLFCIAEQAICAIANIENNKEKYKKDEKKKPIGTEYAVGEHFIDDGNLVFTVENPNKDCKDCYFFTGGNQIYNGCEHCVGKSRKDGIDVKFIKGVKELEIGEIKDGLKITKEKYCDSCYGCKFHNKLNNIDTCSISKIERSVLGECNSEYRSDRKGVIFKEIK